MHELALEALAVANLMTENPFSIIGPEATNALSARWHMLAKDSSAKRWWDADCEHPAIARALRVDRKEEGAVFALAPFRLARIDDKHMILAAYPAPRILGPVDGDWLNIEHVIAWDPVSDKAAILGDDSPQLTGRFRDTKTGTLFGSPRAFFTEWMRERAAFFVRWCASRNGAWAHGAVETDLVPGMLAIGNPEKIRWRPTSMPADLTCIGIDAGKLNRLLLKSAHIPRAHNHNLRAVA